MYKPKLWAVLGPWEGMGSIATRYLLARGQLVIAISCDDTPAAANLEPARLIITKESISCDCLQRLTKQYGKIDTLIDNLGSLPVTRYILPYMTEHNGRIIITPPFSDYAIELAGELRVMNAPQTISNYLCS